MKKFPLLVAFLAILCAFCPRANAQPADKPLHFLVLGDWGSGRPQQKEIADAMARYAQTHASTDPVQWVTLVGDNFYEKGVTSVDDPQWKLKFEDIYDAKRLAMPFIAVLGNHDWGQNPAAEIAYAGAHPGTRWQMDGFYFKRTYGQNPDAPLADFFYIDTDLWNYHLDRLADAQMAWLEDGLKNSKARWQIVVGHHPLYSNGEHGHDKEILALREKLAPLFKQYGVDAYLSGHEHDLERNQIAGEPTLFLVSGSGGKLRPKSFDDFGPFYASSGGFASVTITPDALSGQFLDSNGATLDQWKIAPAPPTAP